MSIVRTLVVDDFEPFRRFLCTALQARPKWQVIDEAVDGLQAVQKAEDLKPDLILLDIGLPALNGIEAAERISSLVPDTSILFVTQQSDPDVVSAALSRRDTFSRQMQAGNFCQRLKRFCKDGGLSARMSRTVAEAQARAFNE